MLFGPTQIGGQKKNFFSPKLLNLVPFVSFFTSGVAFKSHGYYCANYGCSKDSMQATETKQNFVRAQYSIC